MSAYRGGGEKRPPKSERPARAPRTELIVGLTMFALGLLLLGLWWVSRRERESHRAMPEQTTTTATATTSAAAAPTRPPPLSDRQHLATVAAISIAGAAQQGNLDAIAKLAMSLADANTDPRTTCAQYDAAYVLLRQAVLAVPAAIEAGALGDVTAELADLEAARCTPGSDAGT